MSRFNIQEVVQDTAGNALSGASCQVNKREGGAGTVFTTETGAVTAANPIITDAAGRMFGWLENGSYDVVVTPTVGTPFTKQFEAGAGKNSPVTAFPTVGVADGDEVYILADSTNGVIWHFKFRAGSASTLKWEFVGGPPIHVLVATSEATTSLTYAALATAGPSITVPLQGDYIVEHGCWCDPGAAAILMLYSYDIGGTGAVDANAVVSGGDTASDRHSIVRVERLNALAINTALVSKYKLNAATSSNFRERWMTVLPVRCI